MQTLYVDIYFLINFTVDLLSLHLASVFTGIRVSGRGILVSAILGGAYAVVLIFIPQNPLLISLITILFFSAVLFLCVKGLRAIRKIKFVIAFIFTQIIIGGMVYFVYGALEKYILKFSLSELETNRNLIVLSLIVLLSIGVLKILLMLFKNNMSQLSVRLKIIIFEKEYFLDALVDSGNLLKDPMDMSPVMVVKDRFTSKVFPYGVPDIFEAQAISEKVKKRVRAVPISTLTEHKILLGFRPDSVFLVKNNGYEKIDLIIAFDKEGGSFAGFDALIPLAALENT